MSEDSLQFGVYLVLPDDLAEAFDMMRLGILRHKVSGWKEISENAVVNMLYQLQRMAMYDTAASK